MINSQIHQLTLWFNWHYGLVYLVFVSYITLNTKHVSTSERHTCLQSDDYNSWETGTTNSIWTVKKITSAVYSLIDWVTVSRPTQPKKLVILERRSPIQISWLGIEKLNLTQQKYTFTSQKEIYYNTKLTQKTKARFTHLRRPAWKQRGPILVSVLHKFVT